MTAAGIGSAYAPVAAELGELLPVRADVVDVHTHLGVDEDGSSLDLETLLGYLDQVDGGSCACVFPLHDPDRHPAYRTPNDRVLQWARESDGRLFPFCRLDPAEEPVAEAERCLALGARGIKLHPRAQSFGFGDGPAAAIFEVARDARVPILIHAGRGMPPMDALAELALRYPEVPLVLAHAAIADQGMFATRLAEHPAVVYDTSCFSGLDVVELFARVPAERIVFGSDPPYGRPIGGLFQTMRAAAYAGLDASERGSVAGGTVTALLEGGTLPPISPPRIPQVRPVSGRLARVGAYLMMGFSAVMSGGRPPDTTRALPGIALARAAARDPDPGGVGPALERIDSLLAAAEQLIGEGGEPAFLAFGLVMAASAITATEPVDIA
ncbi:MAG: amidohydrolase family protein [Actinomycetota bacterium]|nr:amidohydrolase family protein [Actinomycetota bacterium]